MRSVSLAMRQYSLYLKMGDTTSLCTSVIHIDLNTVPKGNTSMVVTFYMVTLCNFVVLMLSMVGDPLLGNGCGSPNHM